jgi:hypothetical protein
MCAGHLVMLYLISNIRVKPNLKKIVDICLNNSEAEVFSFQSKKRISQENVEKKNLFTLVIIVLFFYAHLGHHILIIRSRSL